MMTQDLAAGILITLLFIALLALFCGILIKLYAHKIRAYTKLVYEKEIETQKAVNTAIFETQEQVLNGISQDLHDDAGQQLTYINFQLENLKLDSPQLQELLDPISDSVARLSASVRSISHSLGNQLFSQQDLFRAIRSEIDRIGKTGGINFALASENQPSPDFDPNQKIIVYRIFQEALNNIIKHSQAKNVIISLSANPFAITVTDDGIGFNARALNTDTLGLTGMAARAELIGFNLEIISSTGNGTTVRLSQKQ